MKAYNCIGLVNELRCRNSRFVGNPEVCRIEDRCEDKIGKGVRSPNQPSDCLRPRDPSRGTTPLTCLTRPLNTGIRQLFADLPWSHYGVG